MFSEIQQRTQPVVFSMPQSAWNDEAREGLDELHSQADARAEAQFVEPAGGICGDTLWDRIGIAVTVLAVMAAFALVTGCGGGGNDAEWPDGVSVAECSLSPDKRVPSSFAEAIQERCGAFVMHQCRTGGEIPAGWKCP